MKVGMNEAREGGRNKGLKKKIDENNT